MKQEVHASLLVELFIRIFLAYDNNVEAIMCFSKVHCDKIV